MTRRIMTVAAGLAIGFSLLAQSRNFKLGQWTEIQHSIMNSLIREYVDTLPLDRMYRQSIDRMLSNLDPYTVYVPQEEQESFEMMISNTYGGIGAIIYKPDRDSNVTINEPYLDSPAARAGLQCGDEILEIDSKKVVGLLAGEASAIMRGKPGSVAHFKVKKVRSGAIVDINVTRERIHIPDIAYAGMLDSVTGYVCQTGFTSGVAGQLAKAVKELKAKGMRRLVLDLRDNGGGLMEEAVKIVGLFVPKGTLVVSSIGSDGKFEYRTQADPIDENLPLMVMVNSSSASASEIVSGAVQDLDRGIVAGTRTYGKGLVQRVLPVAYNGQLKVTVAKYYTPSGRCVQAKDYSHRNDDGSVGDIPDSLTSEFRTAAGRIVKDGGGITPDIKVEDRRYDRVTYAVVLSGITDNYAIEYARKHETVASADSFHLSDADYDEFIDWALTQEFDCRTEAEAYYDLMVKKLKEDGFYDGAKEALDALAGIVKMDKKTALLHSRESIRTQLEEEIVTRYFYQPAGVQIRLRTDSQLKEAVAQWK